MYHIVINDNMKSNTLQLNMYISRKKNKKSHLMIATLSPGLTILVFVFFLSSFPC